VARAERTALEQRLDRFLDNERDRNIGETPSREELEEALVLARQQHEMSDLDHERRVKELKQIHAAQCEALCREIVQANRETARLQNLLEKESQGRTSYTTAKAGASSNNACGADQMTKSIPYELRSPVRKAVKGFANERTGKNSKVQPREGLRHWRGIILFAVLIFTLAIVGQSGYFRADTQVSLRRFETEEVQINGRASFLRYKLMTMIDRWFGRKDSRSKKVRYHIHPMVVSRKHDLAKHSPIFAKESEVPLIADLKGKSLDDEENAPEDVGKSKSRHSLFSGIHSTIGKVGRLVRHAIRLVVSFFRRMLLGAHEFGKSNN
jgi:hypothetical protein